MRLKHKFAFVYVILAFSYMNGQNDFFTDISQFKADSLARESVLIYYHFKGCAPCKRMDDEVLSVKMVKDYLSDHFSCYEVYGFDSLETYYRRLYGVVGNPTFLFLNPEGAIDHRLVGYFSIDEFVEECEKVGTAISLRELDDKYYSGDRSYSFLKIYVHTKERAAELDSQLVFTYLNRIPDSLLLERECFEDILHFGYFRGKWQLPIESRYFHALDQAYVANAFIELNDVIRNRLIISLDNYLYGLELSSPFYSSAVSRLRGYENGSPILLKDLYSEGNYGYLIYRYPSFEYAYRRAIAGYGDDGPAEVFDRHVERIKSNDAALNTLAWGIYEETYTESIEKGLELVLKAIELKQRYAYYDTYAALLFKAAQLDEALKVAHYAIDIAKEQGRDYSDTSALITKIELAIKRE